MVVTPRGMVSLKKVELGLRHVVLAVGLSVVHGCAEGESGQSELIGVAGVLASVPCGVLPRAYQMTYSISWSAATHGTGIGFPANAHFSTLVGATHNGSARMWEHGATASAGVEAMAERGRTTGIVSEMGAQGGNVGGTFTGSGGFNASDGTTSVSFSVSGMHPMVSLVTMLAPSPDWFVGVDSVPLCKDGSFQDVSVTLVVYDAGTDDGATFTAPDADTQPRGTIQKLAVDPFEIGGTSVPLGTFRFHPQ